jgi:hypothetical protein
MFKFKSQTEQIPFRVLFLLFKFISDTFFLFLCHDSTFRFATTINECNIMHLIKLLSQVIPFISGERYIILRSLYYQLQKSTLAHTSLLNDFVHSFKCTKSEVTWENNRKHVHHIHFYWILPLSFFMMDKFYNFPFIES